MNDDPIIITFDTWWIWVHMTFSRQVGRVSLKEEDFVIRVIIVYFVIVIFILFGNFGLQYSVFTWHVHVHCSILCHFCGLSIYCNPLRTNHYLFFNLFLISCFACVIFSIWIFIIVPSIVCVQIYIFYYILKN